MPWPWPSPGVLTLVMDGDVITRALVQPMQDAVPAILDPVIIDRLKRLGESVNEDLLAQLSVLFLADADIKILELRQAAKDDDAVAVVGAGHSLRGACLTLGANDLARLCTTLEKAAADDDLSTSAQLIDSIDAELFRVRAALIPWVGQQ
jgi:HPt (histidine-containing phosphotransfer) domain-containing protein